MVSMLEHEYALKIYKAYGIRSAKKIVDRMTYHGFLLLEVGAGDLIWQKFLGGSSISEDFEIRIGMMKPNDLIRKLNAPAVLVVEIDEERGFLSKIDSVENFLNNLHTFNI